MKRLAWLPLAVTLLAGCGAPAGPPSPATLTLPGVDGGSLSLDSYRGHPLVVDFWASWCGPCRAGEPAVEAAYREYGPSGVAFLGVDWKDDQAAARAFRRDLSVTYPSMYDPSGLALAKLGVQLIPALVYVDARGTVVSRHLGQATPAQLAADIRSAFGIAASGTGTQPPG